MNFKKTADISKLIDTYPEHVWIDLTEYTNYTIDYNTTPVDLNLQCKAIIEEWLKEYIGLQSEEDFPYSGEPQHDRLVSQLVNGFCLKINNDDGIISKVVFIPSEQIDINSFEVAQEWVDLTKWMGDYYVPIQVDVDAQYLHLWGMITHQELKQVEKPDDEMFRYYNVDSDRMVDNLEVLWTSCELAPDPRSKSIPTLLFCAGHGVAEELIKRVKLEAGSNFERLILAFEQWGAILNDPRYLNQYLTYQTKTVDIPSDDKSTEKVLVLRDWVLKQTKAIYQEWKSPQDFFQQPQLGFRGESLEELTLCPEITILRRNRDVNITVEDLVSSIQNAANQKERWDTIECLRTLDPNHSALPTYKLIDLGSFFKGEYLSLLVSWIRTKADELSILIRLSSNKIKTPLPLGIKLSRLDEHGNISRCEQVERDDELQCLQLIFAADFQDLFSIVVTLGDKQLTKDFEV
jgi:hypothetical protein